MKRFRTWWATARSSLLTHRRLKWLWVILVVPTILFWSTSVRWLVFMSIYAIITGHWGAEEAAKAEVKQEEQETQEQPASASEVQQFRGPSFQ